LMTLPTHPSTSSTTVTTTTQPTLSNTPLERIKVKRGSLMRVFALCVLTRENSAYHCGDGRFQCIIVCSSVFSKF
jgi:hypothetical protein